MERELRKRFNEVAYKSALIVVIAAFFIHPLWGIFDYLLVPQHFSVFFSGRLIVNAIWLLLLYLVYRRFIPWKLFFFLTFNALSLLIAYMVNQVPQQWINAYFAGYSTLFIVTAFFIYYSSLALISLVFMAVFFLTIFQSYLQQHSFLVLYANGGMTFLTVAFFSAILTEVKNRHLRNELRARIALEHQKQLLWEKNQHIQESLTYAHYIQSHLFHSEVDLKRYFPKSFLLMLPKEVVSGDFIWISQKDSWVFFALADATGHGIPAAMVSLLCRHALQQSFEQLAEPTPAALLNQTRTTLKTILTREQITLQDGMDIALLALQTKTKQLWFSGANASILVHYEKSLKCFQGDKMPIGAFPKEAPFKNHLIPTEGLRYLYLYSDGFIDQFNPHKKRLKFSRFQRLIAAIAHYPIEEQKERLHKAFLRWKGDEEQIDDVTIAGIAIKT